MAATFNEVIYLNLQPLSKMQNLKYFTPVPKGTYILNLSKKNLKTSIFILCSKAN